MKLVAIKKTLRIFKRTFESILEHARDTLESIATSSKPACIDTRVYNASFEFICKISPGPSPSVNFTTISQRYFHITWCHRLKASGRWPTSAVQLA